MSYDFRERLKRTNSRIPVTSTPKSAKESLKITKKDVDSCFGFDDSDEENNDCVISPIATADGKTRTYVRGNDGADSFKALLARYKQPEPDDGLKVHFDASIPIKTYSHKKSDHDFHAEAFARQGQQQTTGRQKRPRKAKDKKANDAEMTKWFEEKNKEFDDLRHAPLFVTKGK